MSEQCKIIETSKGYVMKTLFGDGWRTFWMEGLRILWSSRMGE